MRLAIGLIAVLALGLTPALGRAASSPAGAANKDIARGQSLAAQWGRCPTARPAAKILALAKRTRRPALRATRARSSVRAWRTVVRVCSQPVRQPTVSERARPRR